MKLSEAIREGIKQDGYQIFGNNFELENEVGAKIRVNKLVGIDLNKNKVIGCCALGAALLAGLDIGDFIMGNPPCPVESCLLDASISHLNDAHHWTREAIADWLEKEGF